MRQSRVIVVALCGALGLAGCGGGGDDDGDSPEGRTGTPAATSAPEETAEGTATPGSALAEQTVEARDGSDVTVDISVLALRVQGELATLELSFTPHDSDAAGTDTEYAVQDLHGTPSGVLMTLVDPVNLKRYLVVRDSDRNALETNLALAVAPVDGTVRSEHTFAAPPADVTKIDVSVGDWTTFRDVPIER